MTTSVATPPLETADQDAHWARQGLLVFALFVIPLSIFGYWFNWKMADLLPFNLPTLPWQLSPGIACIITRLVRREGFGDISFRFRVPRMKSAIQLSFALPLMVGAIAYGCAWLTGLAKFDPPVLLPFASNVPLVQLLFILVLAATAGMLISFPTNAGEEIGWRGYLLPRMIQTGVPQPILLTSLIWGAWHLPVIFLGVYAKGPSVWLSVAGIMVAAVLAGYLLAWLRLGTGSVWAAVIAHDAWNALINAGFTFATADRDNNMWIGEQGILVLGVFAIAILVIRRSWKPAFASQSAEV